MLRFPAGSGQGLIQYVDKLISGARPERGDRQCFASELVHDVEKSDLTSAVVGVEVQASGESGWKNPVVRRHGR